MQYRRLSQRDVEHLAINNGEFETNSIYLSCNVSQGFLLRCGCHDKYGHGQCHGSREGSIYSMHIRCILYFLGLF